MVQGAIGADRRTLPDTDEPIPDRLREKKETPGVCLRKKFAREDVDNKIVVNYNDY